MHRVVVATRNRDKVVEINDLLQGLNVELVALDAFGDLPEVVEDGETLEANAIKKAREVAAQTRHTAIADDTGLEVDALDGRPGIYSSRFAGDNASYEDNVRKLLAELEGVPQQQRSARFRTVIAVCNNRDVYTVDGVCDGVICEKARGAGGFGYDPVFFVQEVGETFAEMGLAVKNRISHRANALRALKHQLQEGKIDLTFYP